MSRADPVPLRPVALLVMVFALAAGACTGAPPPARARVRPRGAAAEAPADAPPLGPARYALTERAGVTFDAAARGSGGPRAEPALYEGARLVVDGGVIAASAPSPEPLVGFRALPARAGGGYVLWSADRTYRAAEFLGPLTPVADAGAVGGVREGLQGYVLRTERGLLAVDPATLAVRPLGPPGLADVVAADDRRAARVDALGRASVTLDGGATWLDLLAARGLITSSLGEADGAAVLFGPSGAPQLRVSAAGLVDAPADASLAARFGPEAYFAIPSTEEPAPSLSSRLLAPEALSPGAATGAILPGGRLLLHRAGGLTVLAAATARPLADADLLNVAPEHARCQPLRAGGDLLLACVHRAAHVLRLDGALSSPRLEATFPVAAPFVAAPGGRLAFAGRCGQRPPGPDDFLKGAPPDAAALEEAESQPPWQRQRPPPPEPEPGPEGGNGGDAPPDEDARVCVRAGGGEPWVERRLRGDDARRLYRWIPGARGQVTALLLHAEGDEAPAAAPPEGVRVIRVRLADPALAGARFPALPDPSKSDRLLDEDFWEDDDGAVRGWLHLPDPEEEGGPEPVRSRRGGRIAGVRIAPTGEVQVFPLPAGVEEVTHGGRFALAMAPESSEATYFESTDGGRSWRPVEGPPVGRLEPPSDSQSPFGCSAIGCSLGDQGMVRLGWGGPPPGPRPPPPAVPPAAAAPSPPRLRVACRLDGDPASWPPPAGTAAPREIPLTTALTRAGAPLGYPRKAGWTADLLAPFSPSARPRRVAVRGPAPAGATGAAIPLLLAPSRAAPADLLLLTGNLRLRGGDAPPAFRPIDHQGSIAAAVELPGGAFLALDAGQPALVLASADAARRLARLTRVPEPGGARLTLATRLDGKGAAVIGYRWSSGDVFAGPLDLARAEVGQLEALGSLERVGEIGVGACAARPAYRFAADVPATLRVEGRGGRILFDEALTALGLLAGGPGRLCAEAVEIRVREVNGEVLGITAAFGPNGAAVIRGGAGRLTCELDTPR